ncbi:thaumatin-like protein [Melampsora larici-populina 98AG31]|uniref:Thaumatin-like protein n=1 Tax=Melampsora larici-populina (strain 98AG31 / pathotype 3-4-7) TaxID=747676 RepID=F4S5G0_MELLP|nr:thaumatin-like protein [Melampsora larici-populina 98AG31]EGG00162.1 thaumatin-like protein [Melampsora larici-populina 98AG31]
MMMTVASSILHLVTFAYLAATISAYTIHFQNSCSYTVWAAVGKAPNGQPDTSVSFGQQLSSGQSADFGVADNQLGIRAWGRTGCDGSGANCQTGACNGGLVCTDAGITSRALLSEYGIGTDGRIYWDLSYVGGQINIPTRLTGPDGQEVYCANGNCPNTQAFQNSEDFGAIRNSAQGGTYNHHFCG